MSLDAKNINASIAPSAISVHSWVSFGHVGHGMASFVLMRMGIRTTMVPCVVYSSSLTYDGWGGAPLEGPFIADLCRAIAKQPEFGHNSAVWTGFMGTPEASDAAIKLLDQLRDLRDDVTYFCDPVLGDRGSLYLPESMVAVYTDHLLAKADVILPNRYELGWLSGHADPRSVAEAIDYANELLDKYNNLRAIFVTGIVDPSDPAHLFVLFLPRHGSLQLLAVEHFDQRHFAGAGDLFSGVVTAESLKGATLEEAFVSAVGRTTAIIEATNASGAYEMRIIENQHVLDPDFDISPFYQKVDPNF